MTKINEYDFTSFSNKIKIPIFKFRIFRDDFVYKKSIGDSRLFTMIREAYEQNTQRYSD